MRSYELNVIVLVDAIGEVSHPYVIDNLSKIESIINETLSQYKGAKLVEAIIK